MSNITNQRDGYPYVQMNEARNAAMLTATSISCWETWRWEMSRAGVKEGSKMTSADYSNNRREQER
jgi:hypothetical protein